MANKTGNGKSIETKETIQAKLDMMLRERDEAVSAYDADIAKLRARLRVQLQKDSDYARNADHGA